MYKVYVGMWTLPPAYIQKREIQQRKLAEKLIVGFVLQKFLFRLLLHQYANR